MDNRRRVLVAMPRAGTWAPEIFERLAHAGFEVTFNEHGRAMTEDELAEALPGVFATIAGSEPYNDRTLGAADELRVVARMGVGYDKVDVAAATRHGVAVAMAFGTNHEAVADHAFALTAALASRLLPYHRKVLDGGWGGDVHASLWRATVGIVGLGRIGRAFARRCRGFEMRVLAYDAVPDAAYAEAEGIEMVPLERLFREADFVSVHAPLTPESAKLVDRERLALMKPGAYLVNTSRGGLVDEEALIEALEAGRIAGAGLDVFATEPLPADSPLRKLPNVVLTPHCAGNNAVSLVAMLERCIASITAVAEGRSPGDEFLLNPEVFGR